MCPKVTFAAARPGRTTSCSRRSPVSSRSASSKTFARRGRMWSRPATSAASRSSIPAHDTPFVHTVELLDWAYGGPVPRGLEHLQDFVTDVPKSAAAGGRIYRDCDRSRTWPTLLVLMSRHDRHQLRQIERSPGSTDAAIHGPFDIIGDVHGCAGGARASARAGSATVCAGAARRMRFASTSRRLRGRRAIFVGDLVDRGPRSPDVLRIVMAMVAAGAGLCVPGNHDVKFVRWLEGTDGRRPRMASTGRSRNSKASRRRSARRCATSSTGCRSISGSTAGASRWRMRGSRRTCSAEARAMCAAFCLYGETSGETDKFGLPIRYHWAAEYRGKTVDRLRAHAGAGCGLGATTRSASTRAAASAASSRRLRWPEREIVSVAAEGVYTVPVRPFGHPPPAARRAGLRQSCASVRLSSSSRRRGGCFRRRLGRLGRGRDGRYIVFRTRILARSRRPRPVRSAACCRRPSAPLVQSAGRSASVISGFGAAGFDGFSGGF